MIHKNVVQKLHSDVQINHVHSHQMNAQLNYLVQKLINLFVLIILVQIVFYNVKFQINVTQESYVQINHVDQVNLCVQNKLLVKVDTHYVKMEIVNNLVLLNKLLILNKIDSLDY